MKNQTRTIIDMSDFVTDEMLSQLPGNTPLIIELVCLESGGKYYEAIRQGQGVKFDFWGIAATLDGIKSRIISRINTPTV